jgi:hypothetical protein
MWLVNLNNVDHCNASFIKYRNLILLWGMLIDICLMSHTLVLCLPFIKYAVSHSRRIVITTQNINLVSWTNCILMLILGTLSLIFVRNIIKFSGRLEV